MMLFDDNRFSQTKRTSQGGERAESGDWPRSRVGRALAVIAMLAMLHGAIACSGGGRRAGGSAQSDDSAEDSRDAAPEATEPDTSNPDANGAGEDAIAEQSPPEEVVVEAPVEAPGQRPEDLTKWALDDFKSAKLDGDPKLGEAVAHLDQKQFHGDDAAAETLFMLLTLDKPPANRPVADDADGGPSPGGQSGRSLGIGGLEGGGRGGRDGLGPPADLVQIPAELASTVVGALGRNDSAAARKHLHVLLTGAVETPIEPQQLFNEVMYAMVDNPSDAHDAKLFELATKLDKTLVTPPDDGTRGRGLTVESARREMLRILDESASPELRSRMAVHLNDKSVTEETAREFERILSTQDDRNLAAQVVLYQNVLTTDATRRQVEGYLLDGSRGALGHLMGVADIGAISTFGRGGGRGDARGDGGRGRSGDGFGPGGPGGGRIGPTRGGPGGRIGPTRGGPGGGRSVKNVADGPFSGEPNTPYLQQPGRGFGGDTGRPSRGGGRPSRDGGNETPAPPDFDPKKVYGDLTKLLWVDRVAEWMGGQLAQADAVGAQSDMLKLLATMPTRSARNALSKLADENEDNPNLFATAGMFGTDLTDPAFLLTAKSQYHNKRASRSGRNGSRGRGETGGAPGVESDPWTDHVEDYVIALGDRFANATSTWTGDPAEKRQPKSEEEPSEDASEDDVAAEDAETVEEAVEEDVEETEEVTGPLAAMGVPLHKGAVIESEYHLRWPADIESRLPGANVAPLEVHYVRIEQEDRLNKLVAAYRRHAGSGSKMHERSDGVWIDGFSESSSTGEKTSVDIRLFNADGVEPDLRKNDQREMIIEILVVKIPAETPASKADDASDDVGAKTSAATAVDAEAPNVVTTK